MAAVPHLRVPFTLAIDGSAATVEQDTAEEVGQCVRSLLATPLGSRLAVPDYGLPDPTFAGVDIDTVVAAVADWEPRAVVDVAIDPTDPSRATVTVQEVQ